MGTLFINSNFAILKWDFAHGFQIFIYYITNVIIGYFHGEILRVWYYTNNIYIKQIAISIGVTALQRLRINVSGVMSNDFSPELDFWNKYST